MSPIRHIFSGMQILFHREWLMNHAVIVEAGRIKAVIPAEMIKNHLPALQHVFPADHYLIPGLIDLHLHGIAGHDVMDAHDDALTAMSMALAKEGVTGFLATTMTAEPDRIEAALKAISIAMTKKEGAAILGVHLEGPFIAASKRGAQREAALELPSIALFNQWQRMAGGAIKIVTMAPELKGAREMIAALHEKVVVAIGHTNATYAETQAAIDAGCTYATHLFNAMRGLHHRDPGAVGALLLSDRIMAELIVDGIHLHPATVELALRLKGKDRLILVTDAMRATCLGDGEYDLGGQIVSVQGEEALLKDGTLAGSVLRLRQAVMNIFKFSTSTLINAIEMASINPAAALQIDQTKGSIAIGKDADLVVMSPQFEAVFTMCEGEIVFDGT